MNSFKRAKTTESGDMTYTEYKGKTFAIPRSEYKKPLPNISGQPSLASTASNHTSSFQPTTNPNAKSPQKSEKQPISDDLQNNPFSLESLVESRETLLNGPTPTSSSQTVSTTKGAGDPQPPAEIADSLLQLKSSVVDLIDKTISDIETKQLLKERQEKLEGTAPISYLHPGGDSPKTEKVVVAAAATAVSSHREQNLKVLKTESFAQSKRDVRKKLYREIEAILVRLKDMDFLE